VLTSVASEQKLAVNSAAVEDETQREAQFNGQRPITARISSTAEYTGATTGYADIHAKLQQAVAFHQRGHLAEAESLYREILEQAPAHFDALHLLGVVQHQCGRHESAIELIQRALEIDANKAPLHSNAGLVLQKLGRSQDALASFDRALMLRPDYAEALYNRGNALLDLKRLEDALASYDRALTLKPDYAEALYNRGNALLELRRPEDALASYDRALALKPQDAEALNNRGNALRNLKRPEEALASYDRALVLNPNYAEALYSRGDALLGLKRLEDALASYDRALALKPDYAEVLHNRGNALLGLKRPKDALASYDRALALKPDHAEALNNRGNALQELKRLEEALASYDRALALNPDCADALNNRGTVLLGLGRPQDALASYNRALALKPDHAMANLNESMCRLQMGDFEKGWSKFEWRWQYERSESKRNFTQPSWLGKEPLHGKTILLYAEQGFGDTIQFCRYARLVAARGANVVMEVQPLLKSLMAGLEGVGQTLAKGEQLPAFDYHCPLLSLPLAFATRLDTIPPETRYLSSDPTRVSKWQGKLGDKTLPRIGLVWSGSALNRNDHNRSILLADIVKLVSDQAQFVSLQKEVRTEDLPILDERKDIRHFGNELEDFADTAALIEHMDVVVTVDTSVAHLAGALGKRVWILLPFNPDWRWLRDRDDSPWYCTARLFRQPAYGDWDSVIQRVSRELQSLGQ
jgi:tetratricopeptide (TPR) repeat protein